MKKKKSIAIVAVMVVTVLALAGCSGNQSSPSSSSSNANSNASSSASVSSTNSNASSTNSNSVPGPDEKALKETISELFVGMWSSDLDSMEITFSGDTYNCVITTGTLNANSIEDQTIWKYSCTYDGEGLVAEGTGTKTIIKYTPEGTESSSTVEYNDGSASFTFDVAGDLVWTDFKETPGNNTTTFEKFMGFADYATDYFGAIAGTGAAGTQFDKAHGAYVVVDFANTQQFDKADVAQMREEMLEGWNTLDKSTQDAFDKNFMEVVTFIDDCQANWDANKAAFTDVSEAEIFEIYLKDKEAMDCWNVLKSNTLTLGNSDSR